MWVVHKQPMYVRGLYTCADYVCTRDEQEARVRTPLEIFKKKKRLGKLTGQGRLVGT
jgi:hypothetical protein